MRTEHYLLAGRYLLVERLGEGGAGTVWRGVDQVLDRQVAVKQVRVPAGLTPQERSAFTGRAIHEARSAGRLRDPAIVLVHDVVLDGDQPWIIMDLVTGRSLDKVIKDGGPLPPHEVARIGLRVLSALETAHMHGMLHHDVKPANILLDGDGSAMLTDFGIAVPLYGQDGGGPAGGSLGYMAPERLTSRPPVRPPTCGRWAPPSTRRRRGARRSSGPCPRPWRPRCCCTPRRTPNGRAGSSATSSWRCWPRTRLCGHRPRRCASG